MMTLLPTLVCALALGAPTPKQDSAAALVVEARAAVKSLLPAPGGSVDIMGIAISPRALALTQKIQAAAAQNESWFKEHIKRSKPGQPLPYHPNLGLSAAEYEEFIRIVKKKTLTKTGEAPLSVTELGKGHYKLGAKTPLEALDGITLDLTKSLVQTPRGTCDKLDRIQTPKAHAFPWDGYVWETITPIVVEESKGRVTRFHIGKLRGKQTGIIYYQSMGFEKGKQQQPVRLIITYPLGKKSAKP